MIWSFLSMPYPHPHRPALKALVFMATHTWSLKKNGRDDRHPYQSHSIPSGNPSNRSPEGTPLLWKVCTYICIFWWSLNLLPEWCKWSPWLSDFQQVHRSLCELFKFTPSPHVPCIHATLFLLWNPIYNIYRDSPTWQVLEADASKHGPQPCGGSY